jgi:hypothetical protein
MLILISYTVRQVGPRPDQLEPNDSVDEAIIATMNQAGCSEVGCSRVEDIYTLAFDGPRLSDVMKERLLAIYPKLAFKVEYRPLVAHPDNLIPVQVSLTNVNDSGVFLTVKRYTDDEVLGVGLTVEEVFEHTEWLCCGTYHPLSSEMPSVALNKPRKAFEDYKAIQKEVSDLYRQESDPQNNGLRYKDLTGPHGIIRQTKARADVLRFVAQVSTHVLTGMWPHEFQSLGL